MFSYIFSILDTLRLVLLRFWWGTAKFTILEEGEDKGLLYLRLKGRTWCSSMLWHFHRRATRTHQISITVKEWMYIHKSHNGFLHTLHTCQVDVFRFPLRTINFNQEERCYVTFMCDYTPTHKHIQNLSVLMTRPLLILKNTRFFFFLLGLTSQNVSNNRKATCICLRCYLIIIFILTLDKGNG